eukprot:gb/GEZN01012544.1/.p1 GENE.gb/GEZN01012544.1/~~gb/GEZN01012544.1/.p1  ORF type:complete len:275 (+),score=33.67 gb/GEZN01012544.1/:179-1003(+)
MRSGREDSGEDEEEEGEEVRLLVNDRKEAREARENTRASTGEGRQTETRSNEGADKVIYLIRHAESTYNREMRSWRTWCFCRCVRVINSHRDALLTPEGIEQVRRLKNSYSQHATLNGVEIVLTSPLTRALQTAVGVFGDSQVPIKALAELCEHKRHLHDIGRPKAELEDRWSDSGVDFSAVSQQEWWYTNDEAEPEERLWERVTWIKAELASRPEKVIAIVSHSNFLAALQGRDSRGNMQNCECLRVRLEDLEPGKRPPPRSKQHRVFSWLPC